MKHRAPAGGSRTTGRVQLCSTARRWLRPGRALATGVVMLLLAAVCSLVLATAADAAPEPTPTPTPSQPLPDHLNLDPDPLRPDPLVSQPAPGASRPPGEAQQAIDEAKRMAEAEEKSKVRSQWERRVQAYKADRRNGGVLSAFEVTDRDGNPISSYRIYSDTGGWKDWDLKIEAFLVDLLFLSVQWLVSFACFLISWSLAFQLARLLLKPALTVSDALYSNVLVQLGLPSLFLTYAAVVAGWHLMFGRKARGWGEAGAALVISALAVTTLAAPPQMLLSEQHGAVGSARALAVEVAALILDNEEASKTPKTAINDDLNDKVPAGASAGAQVRSNASALARPITDELVDAFVVRPAMLLSYGQVFEGSCAKKYRDSRIQQAVADRWLDDVLDSPEDAAQKKIPWIGDTVGDLMDGVTAAPEDIIKSRIKNVGPITTFEKACVKGDAKGLKKASMDKVGGAAFMALAALLVCLFITVLDAAFLYAQVCIVKEAMIAKVALAVGVLPGPGRSWLWSRGTSILRYLGLMVLAVSALAILIVVVKGIINAPEKDLPGGVTVRFIVIDIVCVGSFFYRKKLVRATENLSLRARARLGNTVLGGSAPTDLGPQAPRRSLGRKLLIGGMMVGALAATGGTAGAAFGSARGSTALAARLARGTGRMIGGTAKAAAGTTKLAARGTLAVGKAGLKSTLGLPVYGPRAARRTGAALAAIPSQVTSSATGLGQRLQQIHQQYTPPAQNFMDEYAHGLRSFGRLVRGRRPLGPYTPPPRPNPARPAAVPRPLVSPARPVHPTPVVAPSAARRRPAPPRVPQPAASPAQAALQMRLHRMRNRQTTAPPATPSTPRPARPARPAPRRGGGRP
ncbi:hypothetical protein ACIA8E_36190 [Streptomyces sp. NPDC051664]|uniref:hypothetical protein n=1 Tax=Streptomyces sp. NPDC051664 TaxID=3365668 RepID=UPI0037B6ACC5